MSIVRNKFDYPEGYVFYPKYNGQYVVRKPKYYNAEYIDDEGNKQVVRVDKSEIEYHNINAEFFDSGLAESYGYHKYSFQYKYKKYYLWQKGHLEARDEIYNLLKYECNDFDVYQQKMRDTHLAKNKEGVIYYRSRRYWQEDEQLNINKGNPIELVFELGLGASIWRVEKNIRRFLLNKPEPDTFDYSFKKGMMKKIDIPLNQLVNIMVSQINRYNLIDNDYYTN